jgi:hypothetical protein
MWRSLGAYDTGAGAETGFEWRRGEGGYRRSLLRRRHRADAPALVSRANPRLVRAAAGGLGEAMGGGCGSRPSRVFARAFARSVRDASTGAARPGRSIQRGPEPIKTCRNGSGGSSSRWCVCHRSLPDQVVAKYTGRRRASASARRDGMLPKHMPAAHLLSMLAIGSVRPSLRRANDPVTGPAGKARRHGGHSFARARALAEGPGTGAKRRAGPSPLKRVAMGPGDRAAGDASAIGRCRIKSQPNMPAGTGPPPVRVGTVCFRSICPRRICSRCLRSGPSGRPLRPAKRSRHGFSREVPGATGGPSFARARALAEGPGTGAKRRAGPSPLKSRSKRVATGPAVLTPRWAGWAMVWRCRPPRPAASTSRKAHASSSHPRNRPRLPSCGRTPADMSRRWPRDSAR